MKPDQEPQDTVVTKAEAQRPDGYAHKECLPTKKAMRCMFCGRNFHIESDELPHAVFMSETPQ